ncbi:hypothetical protein JCM19992_03500 [Thermostilla marina]
MFFAAPAWAYTSEDARFLEGLRQRHLYTTAEHVCRVELARPDIPASEAVRWRVALSETLCAHALNSPPAKRPALWKEAAEACRTADDAAASITLIARLQQAIVFETQGRLLRQEAELASAPDWERVREPLREAIRRFRELDTRVEDAIRLPAMRTGAPDALSEKELLSLQKNVRFHWASALEELARTYPPDSPDRTGALTEAVDRLRVPAQLPYDDPLAWPARLAVVRCRRLLGEHAGALTLINEYEKDAPPDAALNLRAERLRIAVAEKNWAEADRLTAMGRTIRGIASPVYDYALLEALTAGWKRARELNDPDQEKTWRDRITELVALIGREDGPYWRFRAEMLVARSLDPGERSDPSMQVWVAENAYRSGRYDEALAAYDQARQQAAAAGKSDDAFRYGFTAAAIEHRRNRHAQAMTRYRELASAMPSHPQAPQAHRLAQYHLEQLLRTDPKNGDLAGRYTELLREYLTTWPQAPDAAEVRLKLARFLLWSNRLHEAFTVAAEMSPNADDSQRAAAVGLLESCARSLLQSNSKPEPAAPFELGQAIAGIARVGGLGNWRPEGPLPSIASTASQQAFLACVRLWLAFGQTPAAVEKQLRDAIAALPQVGSDDLLRRRLFAYLALVAVLGGDAEQAARWHRQAEPLPVEIRCELLQILAYRGTTGGAAAEWTVALAESLQGAESVPAELASQLPTIIAEALAAAGRESDAIERYRRLAEAQPNNPDVLESYATLLARRNDRAALEQALEVWRQIARRSPEASPRWYRAKAAIVGLHLRLGNREQARKILDLVELLHPDLGGPSTAETFQALRKQLGGTSQR